MYTKTDYDITVVVNFDGGVRTVHQDSQFFFPGRVAEVCDHSMLQHSRH